MFDIVDLRKAWKAWSDEAEKTILDRCISRAEDTWNLTHKNEVLPLKEFSVEDLKAGLATEALEPILEKFLAKVGG